MTAETLVSLSFDDGWNSALTAAAPLLDEHGMPATFYIITDFLAARHSRYLDAQGVNALASQGHEIGAHTRTHRHLPKLSEEEQLREIGGSIDALHDIGLSPTTFAYPYGEHDATSVDIVRTLGFAAARGIERGLNDAAVDPMLLRARAVTEMHAAPAVVGWIEEARRNGGWLVLYFHQIEPAQTLRKNGMIYGSTPEVLAGVLRHLRAERVKVVTVAEGARRTFGPTKVA